MKNIIWKIKIFVWLSILIISAIFFIVCQNSSPDLEDQLKIEKNDAGYQVNLNEENCVHFSIPNLTSVGLPNVEINYMENGWQKVQMKWEIFQEINQDELSILFELDFDPNFWWAPHLAPEEGYVIGQHVFRSPTLIAQCESLILTIVPDLDLVGKQIENPWFLDFDATQNKMWLGISKTEIPTHVLFKKKTGMKFLPGEVELSFFINAYHDQNEIKNPWAKVSAFLWNRWGRPLYQKGEPISASLQNYVQHTYNWAFEGWGDFVWQEFDLNGVRVGAPQFIVNVSQSPNYPGQWYQREFLSIWNQAWFSSLRSASGLFRYARNIGDEELLRKARLTKELALAAPVKDGIFSTVIRTDNKITQIDGKEIRRPKQWDEYYWTNSNRSPREHGISSDWYHILDCSWTGLLMLRWYDELENDERLLNYALQYGERLLKLQDNQGFFPGWLHPETQKPGPVMNQTPETSMSVTYLLKLAEITGEQKYREAAIRAMDAILKEIVLKGRWEDFETYWSCCDWGRDRYLGNKIERNDMFKQNSFSMFWTAEALLKTYHATENSSYLNWGKRTLDELSMCQQVWQPSFIYVPALGGFGVMNADGEWNDSRETLFAELFLDYYKETNNRNYFERGISALKSGFVMMYCPENPTVKKMWEKVYPWFGPEDYGFTMENYAHGGRTSPEGEGMGVFTIYDWGNGAASEATMRILDHFGHVYIDRENNQAFGIDKVKVNNSADGWEIINETGESRKLWIVYDDGSKEEVEIRDKILIQK